MHDPHLIACPECDLLHRLDPHPGEDVAVCGRCGALLRRCSQEPVERPLALAFVALLLFVTANAFPLLVIDLHGSSQSATIPGCVQALISLGWPWLAAILITTVLVAPPVYLGGLAYVLIQARRKRTTRWTMRVFRIILEFLPWGMSSVFLLGILVAYVKLNDMATVTPGPSLYALGAFTISLAALATSLDAPAVWDALEERS